VSILFNAAGESITRSTSLPTYTNMSACGFARRTADGDSYGSVFVVRDTTYSVGAGVYTRNTAGGDNLVLYTTDVGDLTIMARPAVNTWFFWGYTCAGTGASQTSGFGRLLSSAALSSNTGGDSAVMTLSNMDMGSVSGSVDSFVGDLYCVKVWDAVLTSAEMLAESLSVFPKRLNNLHLYSRLESADTAGLRDLSSSGRNWTDVSGGLSAGGDAPVRLMRKRGQQFRRSVAAGGPAYNAAGQTSSFTLASTLTLSSFAAAAGSNRFLEVWVAMGSGSPAEPTGVTWGGQAMTKRGSAQSLGSFWNHVKYFIKEADFPGGATGDIVATWAASHDERAISALVHSNVNQTSPYRNASQTVENDGATLTPSIAISSHADDVATAGVWAVMGSQDMTGISTTAGTERTDTGPVGDFEIHSSSTVAGAGTATITWLVTTVSVNPEHTGMLGDSLQGASGGVILGARLSRFIEQPMLRGPF
jgi:hypothetical protein